MNKCSALATNDNAYPIQSSLFSSGIAANGVIPILANPIGMVARPAFLLSHDAQAVLGETAVSRIDKFRSYGANWNGAGSRPLSPQSVASLDIFARLQRRFTSHPSVFLGDNGNLVLSWENQRGSSIEVELGSDRWTFYLAEDDEKVYVPISPYSLGLIAHKLA